MIFETPEHLRSALVRAGVGRASTADDVRVDQPPDEPPAIPVITETEGGWDVGGTVYAERREALAFVEASEDFAAGVARKQPEKITQLAEYRWIDGAAAESMSTPNGSRVTETDIDEMIVNLATEATPAPIDGAGISEVHEFAYNSGARAAGRIFGAAKVVDAQKRAHLFLRVRLLPDVDAQVEAGEMLYGSVCFIPGATHRYTKAPIGARLQSYALTNTPFTDALEPHAARSVSQHMNDPQERIAITRSYRIMKPKTARSELAPSASAPVAAPATPAAAPLVVAAAVPPVAAFEPDARAEGEPTPDAVAAEAYAADVVAELQRLMDMPNASPAALLEALKGAADGALSAEAPEEENAGEGGAPVAAAVPAAGAPATPAEGTRALETRAQVMGLRAQVTELSAKLAEHESASKRAAYEKHLDASLVAVRRGLPPAQRKELLDMAMQHPGDGKRVIDFAVRGVNTPPVGTVTAPSTEVVTRSSTATFNTKKELLDAVRAEVRAQEPMLDEKALRAKTYAVAKSRNAALLAGRD